MSGKHHHPTTPAVEQTGDAWHSHAGEAPPQKAHAGDIHFGKVLVFGALGGLLIVVASVATVIYFNAYADSLKKKSESYPEQIHKLSMEADARAAKSQTLATLESGPTVNVDGGYVQSPLASARQRVVEMYKRR